MPERAPAPAECANCGATIPREARSCPECGADEQTGWRESSVYDGLDLPDEAFADGLEPETQRTSRLHVNGIAWYWWCVAVGLLVVLLLGGAALLG